MPNKSVLGRHKVSSALIQTGAARDASGLVAMEVFLLSVAMGVIFGFVWFFIAFFVLLGLTQTRAWIFLSYVISLLWAGMGYIIGFVLGGDSIFSGLVVGLFTFALMLSWHHWSLAYWRALTDSGQRPTG